MGEKPVNAVSGNTMMVATNPREDRAEYGRPSIRSALPLRRSEGKGETVGREGAENGRPSIRSAPPPEELEGGGRTVERDPMLTGSRTEPHRGGCAAEERPKLTAEPAPDPPSSLVVDGGCSKYIRS